MSALTLERVDKRYGAVEVIKALSLDVQPGEFIVFLGPSGCGKTSLLRMVAGLEDVSAGRVLIGGEDVTHRPPGKRNLALVFQHYALYPHMAVRENLAFGLRNVGLAESEIQRRIAEAARMLELEPLLARRPDQLSGGQRQRVAIGRAVVKEPRLFLFDEPLSNLDAALRGRTRVELARLHQRLNATMVFVTHDQLEAMTLATRIVVMNGGAIEQVGTPQAIYRRPATRFVAGFIGTPAMNLLPVVRAPDAGALAVLREGGGALLPSRIAATGLPAGDKLTLGLRPENLRLAPAGSTPWSAQVELVEFLGERTLAHLRLADGTPVIATVPEGGAEVGSAVALAYDASEVQLFDEADRAHAAAVVTELRSVAA